MTVHNKAPSGGLGSYHERYFSDDGKAFADFTKGSANLLAALWRAHPNILQHLGAVGRPVEPATKARDERIARIREDCRREAEQARERRIASFQTTSPASGSRKQW